MGNVGSCVGRQAGASVSECGDAEAVDGTRSAAMPSGVTFHAEAGTPRVQRPAHHTPVPVKVEDILMARRAGKTYVRAYSGYGVELNGYASDEAPTMAGRLERRNAASPRWSSDSALGDTASLFSPEGPTIERCFVSGDGARVPDRKGQDYQAYFLEGETGYPDWLVVSDGNAQPEGFGKTNNHWCQLMLRLKGVGFEDGIATLERYDHGGLEPLPAASLPNMSRFDLAHQIRSYLWEHERIVLQIGEEAIVIALSGADTRQLGYRALTILDPKARSCMAVLEGELADVIRTLYPPASDRSALAEVDAPPSLERLPEHAESSSPLPGTRPRSQDQPLLAPASGMLGDGGVDPLYEGCLVTHLPLDGHETDGREHQ